VRPKRAFLEICIFLGRIVKHPLVRRVDAASKTKFFHMIRIEHRDQVERPLTDWIREAYEFSGRTTKSAGRPKPSTKKAAKGVSKKRAMKKMAAETR
jgi:hypothetical protein